MPLAENDKRNDISDCTIVPSAKMNVPLETANYPTEIKLTYYYERDIAKDKSNVEKRKSEWERAQREWSKVYNPIIRELGIEN